MINVYEFLEPGDWVPVLYAVCFAIGTVRVWTHFKRLAG